LTAPIWAFCPNNPTFRKNNPFRKKVWEEERDSFSKKTTFVSLSPMSPEEFKKFDGKMMKDYEDVANYLKENNLNPRPSPTPRPFNKEENDRLFLTTLQITQK
jgi:hypothetical protein